METQSPDYRLERWLAVLLSLLFFLPFVAKADEVLHTGSFHGDEVLHRDGDPFLGLTAHGLVPVRIDVETEHDGIVDDEGEATGKRVSVNGFADLYLLRGARLHAGPVAAAAPEHAELYPSARKAAFSLNGAQYALSYRCKGEQCTLVLRTGNASQDLVTMDHDADVGHSINFAGDLDHDGRLDLIADLPTHFNSGRTVLFLSSAAKEGALVGEVAEFATTGC